MFLEIFREIYFFGLKNRNSSKKKENYGEEEKLMRFRSPVVKNLLKQSFISVLGNNYPSKYCKIYKKIPATESFFKMLPVLLFFNEAVMQ